jgi:hypothetical protein
MKRLVKNKGMVEAAAKAPALYPYAGGGIGLRVGIYEKHARFANS